MGRLTYLTSNEMNSENHPITYRGTVNSYLVAQPRDLGVIDMADNEPGSPRRPSDQIIEMVASWPHIEMDEGRFNSTSFTVGGPEIGHLHPRLADIGYPKPLRDRLIEEGQTKEHHVVPNSNTTTFYLESAEDIDHVVWLFRLSYLARLAILERRGELDSDLDIQHELDELTPSDGVRDAFEAATAA